MAVAQSARRGLRLEDHAKDHADLVGAVGDGERFAVGAEAQFRQIAHDLRGEPAPPLPSIRFVISFRDNFIRAFGKRSIDKALDALSGHERMIRKAMLKDGLTHEEAMVKLAERRARQQLREEIEKGKAEVSHQRRAVQAERSGIQKQQRELERRMSLQRNRPAEPERPAFSGAREISDEELAASVQLVAKMMEVDPNDE